jgi:transposase
VPGNGKTRLGYLWACGRPGSDTFFHWETSRAATVLEKMIPENFGGTIQCDGYEAYDCFARRRGDDIQLASCMAHVRRKFHEARDQSPRVAGWLLRQIGLLYSVESRLREERAGPRLRAAVRASQSRVILQRLHRALVRFKRVGRYTPASAMGCAISYALSQWDGLLLYIDNGLLNIDNNHIENSVRPTAIGKKNFLFVGAAEAGERSAILYTVVEACRRRGIDPFAYLRDVFTRLPASTNREIKNLTPAAWAKSCVTGLATAA